MNGRAGSSSSIFFVLLPFLIGFIGAAVLIAAISVYWTIILLLIYVTGCCFQAGCCTGCSYRGRYCPALFGIFLANRLSASISSDREPDPKFFNVSATLAATTVLIILVYCEFWLLTIHWGYAIIFFILGAIHVVFFLTKICPKCGYNDACPGGSDRVPVGSE